MKTAALKAVDGLRLDINTDVTAPLNDVTVDELIAHFKDIELADSNGKTTRTKDVYRYQLDKVISPRWGTSRLSEVKPIAVERWLNEMPGAAGTRYKTKGVMGVLFQHAMRYEWTERNPIRLVRQSTMPEHEQIVLEPIEIQALLSELKEPFRTLILLASVTGLRRGELFGLKWEDVNFKEGEIHVRRSVVDQVEGPPKTLASRRPVPMSADLAIALENWKKQTSFPEPEHWVFASPLSVGKRPYWPDAVLKRHVYPAAKRANITKRIGWHSFRRTLATLLQSSGASVKTTQELLRHASPGITMGIYAKAVTADKRQAQDAIAAMFVPSSSVGLEPANAASA
ncbi:MAG TPA: site-specific integrase [Terriglobales bacterium]|nr:site-specific integrase [Terriglobales bacterium]